VNKEKANKHVALGVIFVWSGVGCELYLRVRKGWIASDIARAGTFSVWMSVLTSLLMLVLNHFTVSTLCSSVYIRCVRVF